MLQQKEITMDKLNEAISFGDIFNEGLGDAIKSGAQAFGANIKATSQVNKQNKDAEKAAALKNAQGNLNAVNPIIIEKLQPIANEQSQFDAETIKGLMTDINKLNIDNKIKKQINQLLNQQTQALNNANNQQKKPEDVKTENPQDASKGETTTDAKNPQQQTEQKGNAANVPEGNRNAIKVKLQGIAKELGQSEDDIIAYIKTL